MQQPHHPKSPTFAIYTTSLIKLNQPNVYKKPYYNTTTVGYWSNSAAYLTYNLVALLYFDTMPKC